jgi:hypothetical protein
MIPGWEAELKGEYLEVLRETRKATPRDFAARLGVSECCAVYWLTELARQGRVRITEVELVGEGHLPCAVESALTCQRTASCPAAGRPLEAWPRSHTA